MATTENGIYYPSNYQASADVPEDMKDMANSIDVLIGQLKLDSGATIELSMNASTYVLTANLKNKAGTLVSTTNVDLPLESMIVNGSYDSTNKKLILTLQSGQTIEIPLADLISGLQAEITAQNKLASDLVNDTNQTNKFATSIEKTNWNAKYDKPNTGIPKTDLANDVQTSLDKADTAIQEHQDISGKEDKSNKVTELTSESTDTQYPSAKAVYDSQAEQDTEIEKLQTEVTNLEETVNSELEDGTAEGTEITVNDSATADGSLLANGNTSQEENPSVENPQPVQVLKGSNRLRITNKNSFCKENANVFNGYIDGNTDKIAGSTTAKSIYIPCKPNTSYMVSKISSSRFRIADILEEPQVGVNIEKKSNNLGTITEYPFTTGNNAKYLFVTIYNSTIDTLSLEDVLSSLQIEYGSTVTDYVEGKEQIKTLTLPNGMEMCKIADYKDEFVKDLTVDKWYKNKKIYKFILTGNENWQTQNNVFYIGTGFPNYLISQNINKVLCNYYLGIEPVINASTVTDNNVCCVTKNNSLKRVYITDERFDNAEDFKAFLAQQYSNNNPVIVYYILETPVLEEITDETLIAELDELLELRTYYGQTNITVEAEDLAPMMTLNYKKSNRALRSEIDTIKARLDLLEN